MSFSRTIGLALLLALLSMSSQAGFKDRKEFRLPKLPGYQMLRCDLHTHSVFSDGRVWPTLRVEEAWRDGLDALAITEHVENQVYADDIPPNIDRSYELALPKARELGLLLVRGAELTRRLPQGHYNAVFLNKAASLKTKRFEDSIQRAMDQKAFIVWNHPGWPRKDLKARWTRVQSKLLERGQLHGIEVVNGRTYFPNAHRWCLEKKLTMLAFSDVHDVVEADDNLEPGKRPFTVALVRKKTIASLREALFARRTVLFHHDQLIGEEVYLRPIFERSVTVENPKVKATAGQPIHLKVHNRSSVPYLLEFEPVTGLRLPRRIKLKPEGTSLIRLTWRAEPKTPRGKIGIAFTVKNLLILPGQGLSGTFPIEVE